MTEPETEVVDAVPVLHEPGSVPAAPRTGGAEIAVQAAAVAGASFVAGAGLIALMRSRRARKNALKLLKGRRRKGRLEVVGTRSFLVDVHFVDRR